MKSRTNTLDKQRIPSVIRQKISDLIAANQVEMIFYCKGQLSGLKALTIVCTAEVLKADIAGLQERDWCRNSIDQHRLIISFVDNQGLRNLDYQHFSYSNLYCQRADLIFAAQKSSYKSCGPLEKKPSFTNCKTQLHAWLEQIDQQCKEEIHQYATVFWQQGDAKTAYLCLKVALHKLLYAFQSLLIPEAYRNASIRDAFFFIKTHLADFPFDAKSPSSGNCDLKFLLQLEGNPNITHSPSEYNNITNALMELRNYLIDDLSARYLQRLKRKFKRDEHNLIDGSEGGKKRARIKNLQAEIATILSETTAVEYIYLIAVKRFDLPLNNPLKSLKRGRHFLLLVVGDQLGGGDRKPLQQCVKTRLNTAVEITLLLHTTADIFENSCFFKNFFQWVLTAKKCLYSASGQPLLLSFDADMEEARAVYCSDQQKNLTAQWNRLNAERLSGLNATHVDALNQLFAQSVHALCYSRLDYIPCQLELLESWKLIQWFLPDFKTERIGSHWESILRRFDKAVAMRENSCDTFGLQEFYAICKKIYSYTDRQLQLQLVKQ